MAETFDRLSHPKSFAVDDELVFAAVKEMLGNRDHQPVREGNVGYASLGFSHLIDV